VGRSINSEIVRGRLNRAVELLTQTPLELKVVAQKAGFGSTSYMHDVFREKLGRTPSSYRARHHGAAADSVAHSSLARTASRRGNGDI
jgi:transcriptional regulator GlxA family with amidase domain